MRSVDVQVARIPLGDVKVREPQTTTFETVEATLRLDIIASSGFKIGRNKAAELIKSGNI